MLPKLAATTFKVVQVAASGTFAGDSANWPLSYFEAKPL
jgi:hypothetical protein